MAYEHAALVAAEKDLQRLESKLAKEKAKQKGDVAKVAHAGASAIAAFGLGYVKERYPDRSTVAGMDLSLVFGGAAFAAGAMGWTGEDELALAVGGGALSVYAHEKGRELGKDHKKKADEAKKK